MTSAAEARFAASFRDLLHEARRYLEGGSNYATLNGLVEIARRDLRVVAHPHGALSGVLEDWRSMVNRCWDEWGLDPDPVSETEFRLWLRAQLLWV